VVLGVFYLLALGPHLLWPSGEDTGIPLLFQILYAPLSVLRRFWWPYRHIAVVTVACAPLAALGVDRALEGLGKWAPVAVLGLVAALPLDLGFRGGAAEVVTSWWEPPAAYQALSALPEGALLELPMAVGLAQTQQSLSYQWIHGRTLVNGHAMWVRRVRPAAWDAWVTSHPLLSAILLREEGTLAAPVAVGADIERLRGEGVRFLSVNTEFFPGELAALSDDHVVLLTALFGSPVVDVDSLKVWDIAAYTGLAEVPVAGFVPPANYLADGSRMPVLETVHSLGWRPLVRDFPPQIPPEDVVRTEVDREAFERTLPPMVERKLERERARKASDAGAAPPGQAPASP
jgi:hypothetical protein